MAATIEGVGGSLAASASEDFLTISADALSVAFGFVPELFLGSLDRFSRFSDTIGDTAAHGLGDLSDVGAEPFDVGLQRGDIGIRLVSHYCPPLSRFQG